MLGSRDFALSQLSLKQHDPVEAFVLVLSMHGMNCCKGQVANQEDSCRLWAIRARHLGTVLTPLPTV